MTRRRIFLFGALAAALLFHGRMEISFDMARQPWMVELYQEIAAQLPAVPAR